MARPKKENAEYFSHDANMRNDPKIKALRKKFKEGYSTYVMFLEYLTDCALFEVEMTDLEFEILSGDFDIDAEILKEILDYCIKIGLLNRNENVFFSNGLKKRLQPVLDKRNNAKDKFLQIKLKENEQKEQKSMVSVTETTQSKVKESKVKESKVNNIKIEDIESTESRKLKFSPPSLLEIKNEIIIENFLTVSAESFFNFYESKNWYVGKNKMKSWKMALAGWESRNKEKLKGNPKPINLIQTND